MKTFAISIPKPCHEDWNNMTPDAKGAFCGSCQKSVYDFSDKTDEEIISVFEKKGKEKVCGRFAPAQLSRPVVSFGNPNSTNRLAIFAYALMLVFGAALFNGAEVFGQAVKGEAKVQVMGKMAMRPIEPAIEIASDTTIQVKQIPPTVCGTKTIVDNKIMMLGQVAVRQQPIMKITGDTMIEDISVTTVIETPPTIKTMGDTIIQDIHVKDIDTTAIIELPIIDETPLTIGIDTIATVYETPVVIDVEPLLPVEPPMTYVTGGISYIETIVEPIVPVPPTDEKTEDKPIIVSETIIPVVEDNTEVISTIVSETVILPPVELTVKVSPNPSSGLIILSYNLETNASLRIDLFDITGKKVKTLTQTGNQYPGKYNVSYNIGDLPNGIYMATLETSDRKSSAKIILAK